jgi:hypothetical protein
MQKRLIYIFTLIRGVLICFIGFIFILYLGLSEKRLLICFLGLLGSIIIFLLYIKPIFCPRRALIFLIISGFYVLGGIEEHIERNENKFKYAILEGNIKAIQECIDSGEAVSGRREEWGGETPLMMAFHLGTSQNNILRMQLQIQHQFEDRILDVIKVLVENKADVNESDRYATPLYYAISHRYKSIAIYLLEKGADATMKMPNGETPLGYAIHQKDNELENIIQNHLNKNKAK